MHDAVVAAVHHALVAAVAAALLALAVALFLLWRKRRSAATATARGTGDAAATAVAPLPVVPLADVERATDGFHPSRVIGQGRHFAVYAAAPGIAAKRMHPHLVLGDPGGRRFPPTAARSLAVTPHPNLAAIVGLSEGPGERVLLVERAPAGALSLDSRPGMAEVSAILSDVEAAYRRRDGAPPVGEDEEVDGDGDEGRLSGCLLGPSRSVHKADMLLRPPV